MSEKSRRRRECSQPYVIIIRLIIMHVLRSSKMYGIYYSSRKGRSNDLDVTVQRQRRPGEIELFGVDPLVEQSKSRLRED